MALPEHSPLLPLDAYQRVMQQGTRDLVDHVHTLETAGRSSRAAKEALNSSLTTLKELHSYNDGWIEQNIPLEYKQGWDDAFKSSLYANPTGLGGAYGDKAFSMMHREAIETLAYNMRDNVDVALAQVGRQMADEFRQVGMEESLRRQFTGATIKQSTKSMVGELQGRGLTQFTDKAGRKWGLDNYCTMVARTTTREATTQGTLLRAKRLGHKLIHLSEHAPTCELCAPLQGRVYTMNEDDKRYPLWHDDYCPVHPNCLHTISVYIDRYDPNKKATLNKSNRPFQDSRSAAEKNAYKGLQRKNQKLSDLRNHHSRYVSRLGADKAGTIQGFARSKAANSARYKELQAAYRQAGKSITKKPTTMASKITPPKAPVPNSGGVGNVNFTKQWGVREKDGRVLSKITGATAEQEKLIRTTLGEVPSRLVPWDDLKIVVKSNLKGRDGSELFGLYERGTMYLNKKHLTVSARNTVEQIRFDILHEAGHFVHNRAPFAKKYKYPVSFSNTELKTAAKDFLSLSDYARTGGPFEAFCEGFAHRIINKKSIGKASDALWKKVGI